MVLLGSTVYYREGLFPFFIDTGIKLITFLLKIYSGCKVWNRVYCRYSRPLYIIGRYVGGKSVDTRPICRLTLGRLLIESRSVVGRYSLETRSSVGRYNGRHAFRPVYQTVIDRVLTIYWPSVDRESTVSRPSVDRESTECWQSVHRVSTDILTELLVRYRPTLDRYINRNFEYPTENMRPTLIQYRKSNFPLMICNLLGVCVQRSLTICKPTLRSHWKKKKNHIE